LPVIHIFVGEKAGCFFVIHGVPVSCNVSAAFLDSVNCLRIEPSYVHSDVYESRNGGEEGEEEGD